MSNTRSIFTFEREFGKRIASSASGVDVISIDEHQRISEEIRRETLIEGIIEGRKQQKQEEEVHLFNMLNLLASKLETAIIEMNRIDYRTQKETSLLAWAFAKKLAGKAIEKFPLVKIDDAMQNILHDLSGVQHLNLQVSPSLVEPCNEYFTRVLHEKGLEVRLSVIPDPNIAIGDCRVEWADGGLVDDLKKIEDKIDMCIEKIFFAT